MPEQDLPAALPEIRRTTESAQIRRVVKLLEKGVVRLDQEIRVRGTQIGTDANGPYWVLGLLEIYRGRMQFLHGSEQVEPPARFFGLFVPPFAIIQVKLVRSHSYSMAVTSLRQLPLEIPREPVVFKPCSRQCPESLDQVAHMLQQSTNFVPISRAQNPTPLAEKIKSAIDRTYTTSKQLSEIAKDLRVDPATMSRYFRKDYGIPPVRYRHNVRVMDGMMRLLEGQAIKDVFQDVGFEDVSRFYKQFSALACASPATYRPKKSKNAKT